MAIHLPGAGDPYFILYFMIVILLPVFYRIACVLLSMMLANDKAFMAKTYSVKKLTSVLLYSPTIIALNFALFYTQNINNFYKDKSPTYLWSLILLQAVILVIESTIVYLRTRKTNKLWPYLATLAFTILPTAAYFILLWLEHS